VILAIVVLENYTQGVEKCGFFVIKTGLSVTFWLIEKGVLLIYPDFCSS
jgi:hypothetical protein